MSKKKNSQIKVVKELEGQLLIQADALGIKEKYTPQYVLELDLDSVKKILTEFYMEKSNLEYEMQVLGTNKKEVLIKLERLNSYIRKGEALRDQYCKKYHALIEKGIGDKKRVQKILGNESRKIKTEI